MQTGDLANWLDLSPSTIKNYVADFAAYLSPQAVGGDGRARHFDEQDARILAHVAAMRRENTPTDEIHAALLQLQADNWRMLPPMPASTDPTAAPIALMPRETADTALQAQRAAYMREVAILSDRTTDLQDRLDTTSATLLDTTAKLGEARGELRAYTQLRWLLLALLAVAVLLALAAVVVR